jgi:hypothetical protein
LNKKKRKRKEKEKKRKRKKNSQKGKIAKGQSFFTKLDKEKFFKSIILN